jgi:hypothetical protein
VTDFHFCPTAARYIIGKGARDPEPPLANGCFAGSHRALLDERLGGLVSADRR